MRRYYKEIKKKNRWEPPRRGQLKINFDGSAISSKASIGFDIRNKVRLPTVAGAITEIMVEWLPIFVSLS